MGGNALIRTDLGTFAVDLELEVVLEGGAELPERDTPDVGLPRVIAAAATGSTVIAVVDHRPPLVVSHDAGLTWRETGGGLPGGRAVAVDDDDPDRILYAARNRLYLSEDGGRFWRVLGVELPAIEAIAFE